MSASQYYNVASMHTMIANAILDINNQGIEDYRYEGYGFGSSSIISNIRPSIAKQLHDTRLASFMAEEVSQTTVFSQAQLNTLGNTPCHDYRTMRPKASNCRRRGISRGSCRWFRCSELLFRPLRLRSRPLRASP